MLLPLFISLLFSYVPQMEPTSEDLPEFVEVKYFYDGTLMDNSKIDGVVYKKVGNNFYVRKHFLYDSTVNIGWFGANGMGYDYSRHVQKAIDITPDNFTILFPKGDYRLANLVSTKSITFKGDEGANIIGIKEFQGYDPIKRILTSTTYGVDIVIDGLNIFGGAEGRPTYHPRQPMNYVFLFENANSVIVKNCLVDGVTLRHGTGGIETELNLRRYSIFTFINCHYNAYVSNKHVRIGYIEQIWISPKPSGSFLIEDNEVTQSLVDKSGSDTWSLSAFTVIDGKGIFRGNIIRGISQSAANLFVHNSIIEDNIIENVYNSVGLDFSEGHLYAADNNIIRRNRIINTKEANISIVGSNNKIYDNILTGGRFGVYMRTTWDPSYRKFGSFANSQSRKFSGLEIFGNIISDTKEEGLFLYFKDQRIKNQDLFFTGVNIHNNTFRNIGLNSMSNKGESIHLHNLADVNIVRNNFTEWGKGHSSLLPCIYIGGASVNITIKENEFQKEDPYYIVLFGPSKSGHSNVKISENTADKKSFIRIYDAKGDLGINNNKNITDVIKK